MEYPYITMIRKYKEQLIMEICDENKNYRVIIEKDNLFDGFSILSQPYKKTEKKRILSVYDLHKLNYIELHTNIQLIRVLNNSW